MRVSHVEQPYHERSGGAGDGRDRRPRRPANDRHALALTVAPSAAAFIGMRRDVLVFLQGFGVPETVIGDVLLGLQEACKNAMRFSHSRRNIDVTVTIDNDAIDLVVHDHGRGFRPGRRVALPAAPPEPLAQHGRGLFLIGALMDEVHLARDHGAVVHMRRLLAR